MAFNLRIFEHTLEHALDLGYAKLEKCCFHRKDYAERNKNKVIVNKYIVFF